MATASTSRCSRCSRRRRWRGRCPPPRFSVCRGVLSPTDVAMVGRAPAACEVNPLGEHNATAARQPSSSIPSIPSTPPCGPHRRVRVSCGWIREVPACCSRQELRREDDQEATSGHEGDATAGLIGPLGTSLVARVSMHEGGNGVGNKCTAGEAGHCCSNSARRRRRLLLCFSTALPPTARVGGRAWPMAGGCSWRIVIGREKCTSMDPRSPRCGQSAKWTMSHGSGGSRRPVGMEAQGGVCCGKKVANVNGGLHT